MNSFSLLVFIVDDVAENIQIAISHLQELGCNFAYALSGEQALACIPIAKPQLKSRAGSIPALRTKNVRSIMNM